MKKAADYAREKCFITKKGKRQHKDPSCKFLKGSVRIETNRRDAYLRGVESICVDCWWNDVKEEEVKEMTEKEKPAMFTFEDLEKLVKEAREKGLSGVAPVMFAGAIETTGSPVPVMFVVKSGKAEPQSTDGEGNVTSVGGTFWLRGVEY